MKIYDISQEVFGCQVYPGDSTPKKRVISSMEKGDLYNLTAFSMCAHNSTHIDAPFHFIKDGKTVDSVSLNTFIGMAYVAEYNGIVSADDATEILEKAKKQNSEAAKRILIKGDAEVSAEAAKVFAESNILLLGNESQTVGPENAPMEVHLILLGAGAPVLCLSHSPKRSNCASRSISSPSSAPNASDRIMTIEPPVLKVPSGLTVSILESVPAAPRNTTEKPVALMIVS